MQHVHSSARIYDASTRQLLHMSPGLFDPPRIGGIQFVAQIGLDPHQLPLQLPAKVMMRRSGKARKRMGCQIKTCLMPGVSGARGAAGGANARAAGFAGAPSVLVCFCALLTLEEAETRRRSLEFSNFHLQAQNKENVLCQP